MGRDGGLPREESTLMAEDGGHIFFFLQDDICRNGQNLQLKQLLTDFKGLTSTMH